MTGRPAGTLPATLPCLFPAEVSEINLWLASPGVGTNFWHTLSDNREPDYLLNELGSLAFNLRVEVTSCWEMTGRGRILTTQITFASLLPDRIWPCAFGPDLDHHYHVHQMTVSGIDRAWMPPGFARPAQSPVGHPGKINPGADWLVYSLRALPEQVTGELLFQLRPPQAR